MPVVKVIRKGISASVRKVPTSTAAAIVPMTLDRVGKEAATENEDPTKVESLQDSFEKFKPGLSFKGSAGREETEFRVDVEFRSLKDFDPENLQKRQETRNADGGVEYLRNDLADLKSSIDLVYRLKDRWKLPTVRRAWSNPDQRKEIIEALGRLRSELEKVAGKRGKS
ncbi:MAG TPA: type VI secretion system contractile sheath small subunit [Methylomirabilota bacterium]|nr:type VI secretion system contractile sheath small subunit [Methylomirabilota bacterium]